MIWMAAGLLAWSGVMGPASARAEDANPPAAAAPADGGTAVARKAAPAKPRTAKGKRPREKEIEGTEARDRFQADTVIKSKYQFNGEQLEVDPD
jgi:hypothetical protein